MATFVRHAEESDDENLSLSSSISSSPSLSSLLDLDSESLSLPPGGPLSSSSPVVESETTSLTSPNPQAPSSSSSSSSSDRRGGEEDAHFRQYYKQDPYLLLHKLVYFLGMGANAAYFPFAIQLWTSPQVGLSVSESGAVFAAGHIVSMVLSPLVMRLADQSKGWRKGVLICGILLQVFFLGLLSRCSSFWSILILEGLQEGASSAIWPSLDASTLRILEASEGNTHKYGQSRAFGAIGWGICAAIFGALYDKYGIGIWWWCFASVMLPVALLAAFIPVESRSAARVKTSDLVKRLVRRDVIVILLVVFLTALLLQIVDVFRFPYLSSLGASNQLLGLSITITALSEAPFFFITSWILARMSVGVALGIVLGGYGVRYIYYSLITDPWFTMPAELMHGVTFALGWAAATQYINEALPPELSTSAQGLLSAIQWGLGAACGSLFGGLLEGQFGWRIMWRVGAGVAFAGLLLITLELRRTPGVVGEGGQQGTGVVESSGEGGGGEEGSVSVSATGT